MQREGVARKNDVYMIVNRRLREELSRYFSTNIPSLLHDGVRYFIIIYLKDMSKACEKVFLL